MNKKKRNRIIACIIAAVVVIAAVVGIVVVKHKDAGKKHITIEVVNDKGEVKSYSVKTDKDTIQQVFDETEGFTYSGSEGPYGLMVDTVNGLKAVYETDQAYWGFKVNNNYCENGISTQKVEDNDVIRVEYTKG